MASRVGSFTLGFALGAVTVVAFRRLKAYVESEDYEKLADSVQSHLQELEARLGDVVEPVVKRSRRKVTS